MMERYHMKLFYGNSGNSILLAMVKVFSTVSGILSTMIVSHALDLHMYGTYSQATLIATTATSLCALGLPDAANFFFNQTADPNVQKRYTNTILGVQFLVGIIVGLMILVCTEGFIGYFENAMLGSYILLIVLRPMFANINCSLQHLVVSIGKARSVAVRNGIFAILRIAAVCIAAYVLKDTRVILVVFLLYEIIVTVVFSGAFQKERFRLCPVQIDWKIVGEILSYCIPMGIYVLTSSLARDVDKMLIGGRFTTDQYAIYANCSTLLPFDIVSLSFLTVLVPLLMRYFSTKDYEKGQLLFQNYIKIGYYTSVTFTAATMLLSREMILFLYGDQYLSGQTVFILYTLVDMVKFANLSIVLSACGRTKTLMMASVLALAGNIVLNSVFIQVFGFIGPALATVVVFFCQTVILLHLSAGALHTSLLKVIAWKELLRFILKLIPITILCAVVRWMMTGSGSHYFSVLTVVGGLYVCAALFVNRKNIMAAIKAINNLH